MHDEKAEPRQAETFSLRTSPGVAQPVLPLKPAAPSARPERRRKDSARLVWDSKPKRPPSPRDIEFQTAEVVIPNPARDAGTLPFTFRDGILHNEEIDRSKMNRLIWGDNLLAMQALLATGYEGKIDLIYIDPPFNSASDYSYEVNVGGATVTKEPSVIERLAYRDTWEAGLDSYLDMLYPRLQLMKRLLNERGSIYVHLDPTVSHHVKLLLDEVYGADRFLSEIVWKRTSARSDAVGWGPIHDIILVYTRSAGYEWNKTFQSYDAAYLEAKYTGQDERGRYRTDNLTASGFRSGHSGKPWRGIDPAHIGGHWKVNRAAVQSLVTPERAEAMTTQEKLDLLDANGFIYWPKKGRAGGDGRPQFKKYLGQGVAIQDIILDISPVNSQAEERLAFQTQKPEPLLERIIQASSQAGAVIADFFCGSGTTGAVAERLGRRWVMSDLGKVGIQVSRARLVQQDSKPFLIENIGNYQREMIYLTGGRIGEMQRIIIKLYGAAPHPSQKDLGTRLAADGTTELVYVGYPDRPTTAKKVEELARACETLDGSGYKRLIVLAWDYDYNFDSDWDARQKSAKRKLTVDVQRKMIPPDVYDYLKKAKTEADVEKLAGKISFHEKPYLKLAKPKIGKKDDGQREVAVGIGRYVIFDLPVPDKEQEKLREAIKDNFAILIDYWAVDWDYDGATFRSQWQAIRGNGKRAKVVEVEATQKLKAGKTYRVAIRVVDVFGNDAAATIDLEM